MPDAPLAILKAVALHLNEQNYTAGTQIKTEVDTFYPLARRVMLQNHYWPFAEKQAVLEQVVDANGQRVAPAFGFPYLFNLPEDFNSLTYLNNSGDFGVQNLKYQILNDKKIATSSGVAYLSYTREEEDVEKFSPVFEYTLGLFIAQNLCYNITRNMDREVFLLRSFNRQKMESIEISHRDSPQENVSDPQYVDARTQGSTFDPDPQLEITPTPLYPS